mgnify:CR=1 FL=1
MRLKDCLIVRITMLSKKSKTRGKDRVTDIVKAGNENK